MSGTDEPFRAEDLLTRLAALAEELRGQGLRVRVDVRVTVTVDPPEAEQ